MTTDQEKSATPISDTLNAGNSMTSYTISRIKEIEIDNIQLREELEKYKRATDIAYKNSEQETLDKLSAATEKLTAMTKVASDHRDGRLAANEQLAIAQAREAQSIEVLKLLAANLNALARKTPINVGKQMIHDQAVGVSIAMNELKAYWELQAVSRTALDEEIRKARKQALEDAANKFDAIDDGAGAQHLRAIADSLTPTSQQSTEPSE